MSEKCSPCEKVFTAYTAPGAGDLASRFRGTAANTGTRRQTAFSMLISVRGVLFQADDHGRARDVLEARVLHPELVVRVGVDRDGRRDVAESRADQGQPGGALADGGFALPFERGVHQR